MKTLLIASLALTSLAAVAQSNISQVISTNDHTLKIYIEGTLNGKSIDYNRTFDVTGLSKTERNALRDHILDSLGVTPPKAPVAPHPPVAPKPAVDRETSVSARSGGPVLTAQGPDGQMTAVGGKQPYTKEVKFKPESGELFIRYRFKKDGDEFIYERTMNARNKSEKERQRIVESIENEIGLPTN
ncbi:hypothetical protein [Larkinella terrae]|uniref:DUF4136 domain-containing protein n=1 Tax=Larkinella terrae TaxID=2025311 RepID=A0A7K0EQW2_9BACT|nr:hypothetical protein [Larkinella terrae]MRS64200.1 hypothetical protein [Larkinella terrae]